MTNLLLISAAVMATWAMAWRVARSPKARLIALGVYLALFAVLMGVLHLVFVGVQKVFALGLDSAVPSLLTSGVAVFWMLAVLGVVWRSRRYEK